MLKDIAYKLENDKASLIKELTEILELPVVKVMYHLEEEPIRHFLEFYINDFGGLGRIEYAEYNRLEAQEDAVSRSTIWRVDTWSNFIEENSEFFRDLIMMEIGINEFTMRADNMYKLSCWKKQEDGVIRQKELIAEIDLRFINSSWRVRTE